MVLVEDELPDAYGNDLVRVGAFVVLGGVELLIADDKHRRLHQLALDLAEEHVRVDVLILARLLALLRHGLLDRGALLVARLHVVLTMFAALPAFCDRRPQQAEERVHVRRARLVVHIGAHVAQPVGVGAEHGLRKIVAHGARGAHRANFVLAGGGGHGRVFVVRRLGEDVGKLHPPAIRRLVVREDGRQDVVVAELALDGVAVAAGEEGGALRRPRRGSVAVHGGAVDRVVVAPVLRRRRAARVAVVHPRHAGDAGDAGAPARRVPPPVGAFGLRLRGRAPHWVVVAVFVLRTVVVGSAPKVVDARRPAKLPLALPCDFDFAAAAFVLQLREAFAL